MKPIGSYQMKSGKWFVSCFECVHGINGNQDCGIKLPTIGLNAKNNNVGCAIGELLPKYKVEDGSI